MADTERMKWTGIEYEGSTEDGKLHAIKIVADDASVSLVIEDQKCWPAAHFLLRVAQAAAEQSGGLKPPSAEARHNVAPITAIAIGAAPGRSQGAAFFAVHIGTDNPVIFETTIDVLRTFAAVAEEVIARSEAPSSGKLS